MLIGRVMVKRIMKRLRLYRWAQPSYARLWFSSRYESAEVHCRGGRAFVTGRVLLVLFVVVKGVKHLGCASFWRGLIWSM